MNIRALVKTAVEMFVVLCAIFAWVAVFAYVGSEVALLIVSTGLFFGFGYLLYIWNSVNDEMSEKHE